MNLNKVTLIGRITSDIELKATPSGISIARFGLATNRTWKNKDGEKKDEATFHNIVAWQKLAEIIGQYCNKGDMILVEGRISNRTYERENQTKGYVSEVIIESFQFGVKKQDQEDAPKKEFVKKETKKDLSKVKDIEKEFEDEEEVVREGDEIDVKDIPF